MFKFGTGGWRDIILLTARCDVDIINDRHDTLFGGRLPSPSAATLTKLSSLVVEMISKTGKGISEMLEKIHPKYSESYLSESDFKFSQEKKKELQKLIYEDKVLADGVHPLAAGHELIKLAWLEGFEKLF